ncbi:MAG: hypothetical protein Q8R98_02435 [Rubrivivax sp.]|nr:hypothetical protein [Rubrivivax sp.]MDP3610687.1 hypothetical protein [Rubrivivax sp.]
MKTAKQLDEVEDLEQAKARIRSLEDRVEELSKLLNMSHTQQREWLRAQLGTPDVPHLVGLTVPGSRVKLTCEVLLEVYRTHAEDGVAPYRIAKTLRVDHKCIANFLKRDYSSQEALKAYKILGLTPKWLE